ncbi:UNVERIFIED_CONTAM: Peroxisomal fatty acid beta-oxidation multifunctional protein MFP2 [Sesamum radiatum]|uniref:Peroxisomal fatty acid beta-oxidation multifunctional protein MFP2 n=1 Tax=Sesamum radiatum TaxID=300843 RepID=A0AAW2WBN3_SESRA
MELGFMSIQIVTDTLEAARKPFVAAIEGPAFGGGLEIALAESESLSLKQEIFSNLEKCCPLHCIFTSNISTFSVKLVGERTKSQHRIAGIHFFWGGIIYWSDSFGSKYICSRLEKWSKEYGAFFRPCDYIMERSAKNISLVSNINPC